MTLPLPSARILLSQLSKNALPLLVIFHPLTPSLYSLTINPPLVLVDFGIQLHHTLPGVIVLNKVFLNILTCVRVISL